VINLLNRLFSMDLTKFSNLPGIDTYNADVYESSDLPEDDQADRAFRPGVDNSESVERINISFADAQNQFAHSEDLKDKKDDIFQNRLFSFGYFPRSEYEIISERNMETPTQKFERLKAEVSEFITMTEKMDSSGKTEAPTSVQMRESAKMLLEQLQEVHLDKIIKCEEAVLDPEGSIGKKLTNEVAQMVSKGSTKADNKEDKGDRAKYEVYVPAGSGGKSATLVDLEKRVAILEKSVGSISGAEIATFGSEPNLVAAIEKLEEKVFLLDKANLEFLEIRLQSLIDKLKDLKAKPVPSEKLTKVSEMLEIAHKWDAVADTLPNIVDRLSVLDSLHQQTLQFSQALSAIDGLQQQINSSTKSNTTSLEQLKSNMNQNMENIQSNIASLEKRLGNVKK